MATSDFKNTNLKIKILIAAIVIFLFFGISEVILRLAKSKLELPHYIDFPAVIQVDPFISDGFYLKDPVLFWRLSPSNGDINSMGFRDREFSIQKPAGVFRIMSMGDSVAYGALLPKEQAYAKKLESLLNEKISSQRFEVINAAVPGYSSFQGLRYLQRGIIKYKPDLIILHFGFDDACPALHFQDKEQKTHPIWLINIENLLNKSRLYQLLNKIVFILRSRFRNDINLKSNIRRVTPQDYRENLLEMTIFAKSHNIKTILVTPIRFENGRPLLTYGYSLPDFPFRVDYLPRFIRESNCSGLFLDDCHLSPKGHQIVAEEILDVLKKEGLLEQR